MLGFPISIVSKHKLICNAFGLWYAFYVTAEKLASVIHLFEQLWLVYIFSWIHSIFRYCLNKHSFHFLYLCIDLCIRKQGVIESRWNYTVAVTIQQSLVFLV